MSGHEAWVIEQAEKLDDEIPDGTYMGMGFDQITSLKAWRGIAKEGWKHFDQQLRDHRRQMEFVNDLHKVRYGGMNLPELRLTTIEEIQDHMNTMQLAMPMGVWLVGITVATKKPSSRKWWERVAGWFGLRLLNGWCFEMISRRGKKERA